jgi:2-oxoglutarate dehydrogenase complex dehydrogenase (E1) component-like enzyme
MMPMSTSQAIMRLSLPLLDAEQTELLLHFSPYLSHLESASQVVQKKNRPQGRV